MNANEKFVAAAAHVDEAAVKPLPNSRKIYVEGSRPDIRVPMREIAQDDTPTAFGGEKNPPIFVSLIAPAPTVTRTPGSTSATVCPPSVRLDRRARRHRGTEGSLVRVRPHPCRGQGARRTALPRPVPQAAARKSRQERHATPLRAARAKSELYFPFLHRQVFLQFSF